MIFKPDLFSNNVPVWNEINNERNIFFNHLCKHIPKSHISELSNVYYSGAFEINSSNYKIECSDGKSILLKKWPLGTKESRIHKIQRLTNWLIDKNIPASHSGFFLDGSFVLNFDGALWSYNLFNNGNYFSGINNELKAVAKVTGKLARVLIDLPADLVPERGPVHLSKNDDFIIDIMRLERANWSNIFGKENSSLLNLHWDYVYKTWKYLYKNEFNSGTIVPCHFDMHPHNLIVKDGEVVAVLDFDSCKKIPLGYSLAFNALKQCRQFLSLTKEKNSYNEVFDIYFKNLKSEISIKELSSYDFLNLSKVEVMRRICLIFRINLIDNNSDWNHVLPIQLAHLYESNKLFKK